MFDLWNLDLDDVWSYETPYYMVFSKVSELNSVTFIGRSSRPLKEQ